MSVVLILCILLALFFLATYLVFQYAFGRPKPGAPSSTPPGEQYKFYREEIKKRAKALSDLPCEEVTIQSQDGLKLVGSYYHLKDGAPLAIFFHGYRSTAIRDFCGGFHFYRNEGFNLLLVDQRCIGRSEGKAITFGIRERWDCLEWAKYAARRWPGTPILLLGISMGASTVLMASDLPLPKQVIGILGDCPFSSPKDILCSVAADMGLPVKPSYALLKFGAKLFGGFDPDEASTADCLTRAKLPVVLIHGEADDYVPCEMSLKCFEVCRTPVRLLTVPGAEHGMSFFIDEEGYAMAVGGFARALLAGDSLPQKERLLDYIQRQKAAE